MAIHKLKNPILKLGALLSMLALPFFTTTAHAVSVTTIAAGVAGSSHTCAVTINGAVKCWGLNHRGQLGDGTTGDINQRRLTPVNVKGLHNGVTAAAAGNGHSCALTRHGGVKCWGHNYKGALGDGTTNDRLTPIDVVGLSGVTAISAGAYFSCVLTTQGGVKCWGKNDYGEVGNGVAIYSGVLTPVDVIGLSSGITAITTGMDHACALSSVGGVKCWGTRRNGQLGDGQVGTGLTPVDVVGLSSGVTAIAAGLGHTCALTAQGGIKCWGSNGYGQLGNGALIAASTPVDVIGLSSGVAAIAVGDGHTCALTTQGGIKCWGWAGFGQLGDGTLGDTTQGDTEYKRLTPVDVIGLSAGVRAIAAGAHHTCAVLSAGGVKCWGENENGMLGDGTITDRLTPVDVLFDRVKNDYTNYGIAGWYWKGQDHGVETLNQVWQLTFPLYSNNWAVPRRSYPPPFADQANWDIVTAGDFDKDSDADILWRHTTLASWKLWQMENGTRVAQTAPADFDLAHEWTVVGAGDTDKDGDDDVILNKTSTGEVLVWEMQNHAIANTHTVGTKAGYVLNRIGDFNKDGDVDLLFRQNGGDVLVTWELQANAFVAERALASTGAGWNPVCAGDFDADGDDDIMLINSSTTQEKWFVMENYTRTQAFGATNPGFVFQGCGDYDGDGDADIKSQRSSDDMNRIVLQANVLLGSGVLKQTVYTNPYGGVNPDADGYGFVYRGNSN